MEGGSTQSTEISILKQALELAGIGTWELDLVTQTVAWDERCKELYGFAKDDEVPYDQVLRYMHPDDAPMVATAVNAAVTGQNGGAYEAQFRTIGATDKKLRWLLCKGQAHFDTLGAPLRFTGTAQDITEVVNSRDEVNHAQRMMQLAIVASGAGTFNVWKETGAFDYSPQLKKIFSGSAEGVLTREAFINHIHPDDRKLREEGHRQGMETGHLVYEARVIWDDGSIHWVRINGTYHRTADGKDWISHSGIVQDITEVKLSVQRLADIQAALDAAIDAAELGTWELNPELNIIRLYPRFRAWLGFTEHEVITVDEMLATIAEPRLLTDALERALQEGSDGLLNQEVEVKNRENGRRYILRFSGRLFEGDVRGRMIVGTAQDMTIERDVKSALEVQVQERTKELAASNEELMAANEELSASTEEIAATNEELAETVAQLTHKNEELEQYAYVASHDLQEPLRKISVFADILERTENMPAKGLQLAGKISSSSERMRLLIKDLLEFSRLLRSDGLLQTTDLNKTAAAIISDFELTIAEKQAVVEVGNLPQIEAISLQMNQLFYNLVGNALKFIKPGETPHIKISATLISTNEAAERIGNRPIEGARYYRFMISDNGIGFEDQYAEQIFQIFKRLHTRESFPGSGIGLALCRRIALYHNGALYVYSQLGQGTTFSVVLPDRQG